MPGERLFRRRRDPGGYQDDDRVRGLCDERGNGPDGAEYNGRVRIENTRLAFLAQQLDCIFTDIYPDAVKTGMISTAEIAGNSRRTAAVLPGENIVVDPVMVSTSGSKLISGGAVAALKEQLFRIAALLTPNIPEAEVLAGVPGRYRKI